uniref:Uncharacterized protein n=1 Tax=Romanomermis culicivorax TaxID=13658 RepID=A0A915ITV6_ROMCU
MMQLKQTKIFLFLITLICLRRSDYCNGQDQILKNYPLLDKEAGDEQAISLQIVSKIDSLEKEISHIKEILSMMIEIPNIDRSSFEKRQRLEADDSESPQAAHNNKRKPGGQQLPYFGSRGRRGHIKIPYMGSRG